MSNRGRSWLFDVALDIALNVLLVVGAALFLTFLAVMIAGS